MNHPGQSWSTWLRRYGLVVLLLSIAIKQVVLVWAIPPWEIPDEQTHVQYVQILAEERRFPVFNSSGHFSNEIYQSLIHQQKKHQLVDNPSQPFVPPKQTIDPENNDERRATGPTLRPYNRAAPYAPLYYLYEAIPYLLLYEQPIINRLHGMRLASSVLLLLSVWLAFRTIRRLNGGYALAWTVAAAIGWQPMVGYIFAGVNNDALATLLGTLVIMLLAKLWQSTVPSWRQALLIGLVIGLGLANKQQAVIFLPVALAVWWAIRKRLPKQKWFAFAALTATTTLTVGFSWTLYTHFSSPKSFLQSTEPAALSFVVTWPKVVEKYVFYRSPLAHVTSWGYVGAQGKFYSWRQEAYILLALVSLMSLAGLTWSYRKKTWPWSEPSLRWLVRYSLFSWAILEGTFFLLFQNAAWKSHLFHFPAHGRYYYGILLPLMAIFVLGLAAWFPSKRRVFVYGTLVAGMVALTFALIPLLRIFA